MDKKVFVLCDARSGSSLCGGILHRLGVNMGDNLKPPSPTNKKGYYEDQDLNELCEDIYFDEITEKEKKKRAKEFVEAKSDDMWGMKTGNPKLNKSFPYIAPHCDNIHIIVTKRNREDQIDSMQRAIFSDRSRSYFETRLNETYSEIDEIAEDYPRFDVQFERWFNEPEEQMQELCEFLEVEPTEEAYNFIDPNLRNYG